MSKRRRLALWLRRQLESLGMWFDRHTLEPFRADDPRNFLDVTAEEWDAFNEALEDTSFVIREETRSQLEDLLVEITHNRYIAESWPTLVREANNLLPHLRREATHGTQDTDSQRH